MLNIAICDDEPDFINHLNEDLTAWAAEHSLPIQLSSFTNGDSLILAHARANFDLIFLDIVMPLLNGMEAAKELRLTDSNVPIIFLTSSPEFAIDSYEVRAFWYLIKPVSREQLFHVLDTWLGKNPIRRNVFPARTAAGYQNIYLRDVEFLEAQNKTVSVFFLNGTFSEIKEPFHKCEEIFTLEKGFFKCHRSYIISLSNVEKFSKKEIITKSGRILPISRDVYNDFKDAYFSYMFPE